MAAALPSKPCVTCGRVITWRRKWERCWDEVRYCSDRCRAHKPGDAERQLEALVLEMTQARGSRASLCPSEVARALQPEGWEARMEDVRQAARRLVVAGRVEILQGGRVVDPSTARGPIRIRIRTP